MDIEEMKRHVRLLEDHFQAESDLAEDIIELGGKISDMTYTFDEGVTAITTALAEMRDALDRNTTAVDELLRRKK
jgi:hypothetical protein